MNTAPSSHSFIIGSRWIGVCTTALLLLMQQRPVSSWWVWCIAVGMSAAVTIAVQPVTRLCIRHPLLMGIDIVCGAGMVVVTGGWISPFYPTFVALLMLPAILYGIRGGVIAGFASSTLCAVLFFLYGIWDTEESPALLHRMLFLAAPVAFGMLCAAIAGYTHKSRTHEKRFTGVSSVEFPQWVGRVMRRVVPRFPRALTSMRSARTNGFRVTQTRSAEVRLALYAAQPQDVTLPEEAQLLTDSFERTTHIAARCVILGRPKPIQLVHCDSIRRLIIESLINVEQHAQASSVSVLIRFDDRTVTVVIQDDGNGLPDTGIRRAGLHSLQMLIYRVSEVGGRLEVFTTPAGGVAVRAAFPLSAEEVIV